MTEIHKPKPDPKMMTQEDPAIEAYIEQLEQNNKDLQEELYKQSAKIDELKKENARLEESFQRATGEIAADPLPSATVDRERFGKAAEEVFDNVKDELDRVAIADFVNQLDNALFGGAQ